VSLVKISDFFSTHTIDRLLSPIHGAFSKVESSDKIQKTFSQSKILPSKASESLYLNKRSLSSDHFYFLQALGCSSAVILQILIDNAHGRIQDRFGSVSRNKIVNGFYTNTKSPSNHIPNFPPSFSPFECIFHC